jgi:hypothetical protein
LAAPRTRTVVPPALAAGMVTVITAGPRFMVPAPTMPRTVTLPSSGLPAR